MCYTFRRKKQSIKTASELTEMLELKGQDFKTTFINIFKDITENMDIMCKWEKKKRKEMEIIKRNKYKFSE